MTFRVVDTGYWVDSWIESLGPDGKLLDLYLITNPRSTSAGVFEITLGRMSFETGLDAATIERLLVAWAPKVQWFPEHSIVFLSNFFRRQGNTNERTRINARRIVAALPEDVQRAVLAVCPELTRRGIDTLSVGSAYPSDQTTTTTTINNDNDNDGEGAIAPAKPTL